MEERITIGQQTRHHGRQCATGVSSGRSRPGSLTWIVPLLLALSVCLSTVEGGATTEEVVSGVLESVNLESNTVRIRNALDQPILLKFIKPHLLENITPGERVTVVINEHHEIIKLIETPIPELRAPMNQ